MEKTKKILTWVSLGTLAFIIVSLIINIFGVSLLGTYMKCLLTAGVVCVVSAFSITSLSYMNKNKILSIVSLSLLWALGLLLMPVIWSLFSSSFYGKFMIILSLSTVLANIIIYGKVNLNDNYKAFQIVAYICFAITYALGVACTIKPSLLDTLIKLIICSAIVSIGMLAGIGVMVRKNRASAVSNSGKLNINPKMVVNDNSNLDDKVVLTKQEYLSLITRLKELEDQQNKK